MKRLSDEKLQAISDNSDSYSPRYLAVVFDLIDARRALAAKARGGAYDAAAVEAEAHNRYRGFHPSAPELRNAFIFGAQYQAEKPAPSAPTPEPAPAAREIAMLSTLDLGPSYLERLRDKFAVAHAGSGSLPADAYVWADECMKRRDTK